MTGYAHVERHALANLMAELGPDAPTLCAGWTTRDLAAHLVIRERRPDAAAGMFVPALRGRAARVHREYTALPYPQLIGLVRVAPWWSPVSNPLVDPLTNPVEFFVHHEDVRRAQPQWQPRALPAQHEATLWARIRGLGRLAMRKYPAAVHLHSPGYGDAVAGAGGPQVHLTGPPGELAMFLTGRQPAAQVQLDGAPEEVDKLRTARLGI